MPEPIALLPLDISLALILAAIFNKPTDGREISSCQDEDRKVHGICGWRGHGLVCSRTCKEPNRNHTAYTRTGHYLFVGSAGRMRSAER